MCLWFSLSKYWWGKQRNLCRLAMILQYSGLDGLVTHMDDQFSLFWTREITDCDTDCLFDCWPSAAGRTYFTSAQLAGKIHCRRRRRRQMETSSSRQRSSFSFWYISCLCERDRRFLYVSVAHLMFQQQQSQFEGYVHRPGWISKYIMPCAILLFGM